MVQFVFVHGHGEVPKLEEWLDGLSVGLRSLGYPDLRGPVDEFRLVDYSGIFGDTTLVRCAETYAKPEERILLKHRHAFMARRATLNDVLRPYAEPGPDLNPGMFPKLLKDAAERAGEFLFYPGVRKYLGNEAVRHAAWRQLMKAMPKRGAAIIVAHSFGAVVVADALRRMPPRVRVELLVTIGSPLAFDRCRSHFSATGDAFPFERVRRWVNGYSPLDLVTGGEGISGQIAPVLDVNIGLGAATHDIRGYLSHASIAKAIGWVAFDQGVADGGLVIDGRSAARRMHEDWTAQLLASAFTRELTRKLDGQSWKKKLRLEAAREEVARRVIREIQLQRQRLADQMRFLEENGYPPPPGLDAGHPLAEHRYPTIRDLTEDSAALVRGNLSDSSLVPLAIGLMLQPVLAPFSFEVDRAWRAKALVGLFGRIRVGRRKISDKEFADQIHASVWWAIGRLKEPDGFPWGKVMFATGAVLLAATGVGILAAAPAGLFGAAVTTSTLAAFGPGGMVGGLISLGALTGTGAGLVGAGLATELRGSDSERDAMTVAAYSGAALAAQPFDTFKSTICAMIATVHAQAHLTQPTTELVVNLALRSALDCVRAEYQMYKDVDAPTAGEWAKKSRLLRRAIEALDSLTAVLPSVQTSVAVRRAISTGDAAKLPKPPERPALA